MYLRLSKLILAACALALLFACARDAEEAAQGLLEHVPADTPYVFVTSKRLPDGLRERFAGHYAEQLATQRQALARLRDQIKAGEPDTPLPPQADTLFDVLDAFLAEFEGRGTPEAIRELGIEPVTRSLFYGIGLLPAMRVEILDASKLNTMLDRVEQRAGARAVQAESAGQVYRRIDLGGFDMVIAATERHLVAGLLADGTFDRDLPLLLGQEQPDQSLAQTGVIDELIDRHAFTGYGEGYFDLETLVAAASGQAQGRNGEFTRTLGAPLLPATEACNRLARQLVVAVPRVVMGVTEANDQRMAVRGIWEASPAVSNYLQKLAAPVPGVGGEHEGLLSMGIGMDLPQLRNAIQALLRTLVDIGADCEWVDKEKLDAIMPQLNLALGPMTAGIKGFNLRIDDLQLDAETLQPVKVSAGLIAAVDDPRGVFALGAMFNPGLAALQIPDDGSFVELPSPQGLDAEVPPLKVAVQDRTLVLLAGQDTDTLATALTAAKVVSPSPLLAFDYGVRQIVESLGGVMEQAVAGLQRQGEHELAAQVREQLESFRMQSAIFERLRVSLHAAEEGLVIDQVMELR